MKAESRSLPGITLLIVEDGVRVRERMVCELSEAAGIKRIVEASSAEAALRALHTHRPEVVIVDIQLPDASGLTVLNQIRLGGLPTQAIVFTNHPSEEIREACRRLGVRHFFPKTTELDVVAAAASGLACEFGSAKWVGHTWPDTSGSQQAKQSPTQRLSPAEVIYQRCLMGGSCAFEFEHREYPAARVFLQEGAVVHAECGDAIGIEAFARIVAWRSCPTRELEGSDVSDGSTLMNWQAAVMSVLRLATHIATRTN